MSPRRNDGRAWEAEVSRQNQELANSGEAIVTRMATHHHGGIPSRDPKVDYVGALAGGRCVAFEAKSGTGVLTGEQRNFLAHLARAGALTFVYHADGWVAIVGEDGKLGAKKIVSRWHEIIIDAT
jgi:hypothetical protein